MNRNALYVHQLKRLNLLIKRIRNRNQFYTKRLTQAGLINGVESLEQFYERMPFTTKQDLINDHNSNPPYGTTLTYPVHEYNRYHQTSGTTSSPLRWLDTHESWNWVVENWKRVYEAAYVNRNSHIFFAFSFGPFLGFWSAMDAARQMGCLCIPGGGMSSEARVQSLIANRVEVLCCTPTYALRLADIANQMNVSDQLNISKVIVAGEPGGSIPSIRNRIENAWGENTRVFDHHGMTEIGPVSYECEEKPYVLHIIEWSYIAEVIHPDTFEPVSEGETGELVLTTLGRDASPILRYRTGDMVNPSWKGKPEFASDDIALVGGLIGRIDDMVIVRGVNVYPSMVDSVVRSIPSIAEYRVVVQSQHELTELEIEIELHRGSNIDSVANQLETEFRNAINLRVPITVVEPNSLPRFDMKAKRWIRIENE
jgi:phenylacetate-CoA ligase